MAVSESRRHELHERVRTSANEEVAETLMDLLPPVGWADVATKRDLEMFRLEWRADLADLTAHFERAMRHQLYWFIGATWSAVGVVVAVFA